MIPSIISQGFITDRFVASGDLINVNRGRRVICLPGYSGHSMLFDPSTPLRATTQRRYRPWRRYWRHPPTAVTYVRHHK